MPRFAVKRYKASWSVARRRGRIKLDLGKEGGEVDLRFGESGEFAAMLLLLARADVGFDTDSDVLGTSADAD
jgi:hypothetical protein